MNKLNNKGFTLVEVLGIIIALAIVGGAGFYVVNANKDGKKTDSSSVSPPTNQKPAMDERDYLEVKELGIKFDKTTLPTTYYKISESERKRAYPEVPELTFVVLYDSSYDDTTNSYGQKCGDMDSSLMVVQIMKASDRDKKYAKYANAEIGLNDSVPTVVSGKYAKKVGDYLYDYYKPQGVQAPINCLQENGSEDFDAFKAKNTNVQQKFDSSYKKLQTVVETISKK